MIAFCFLNAALYTLGPSEQMIRKGINENEVHWPYNKQVYLAYGPLAYPAYRVILEDKHSTPYEVFHVLQILSSTRGDIRPLGPQLLRCLTNATHEIRSLATELYGRHATTANAPEFGILLFDPDRYVIFAAAEVLSKVGDRNALKAMELWQLSKGNSANEVVRSGVKGFENELRVRLEKEEAERKKAEPPKK